MSKPRPSFRRPTSRATTDPERGAFLFLDFKLGGDRPSPLADPAGALAKGDGRQAVVVADGAVGLEAGTDIGAAAEHLLGPDRVGESVEMDAPVEHRQHRGTGTDRRADRVDRLGEIVLLRGQQDKAVGAVEPLGGGELLVAGFIYVLILRDVERFRPFLWLVALDQLFAALLPGIEVLRGHLPATLKILAPMPINLALVVVYVLAARKSQS